MTAGGFKRWRIFNSEMTGTFMKPRIKPLLAAVFLALAGNAYAANDPSDGQCDVLKNADSNQLYPVCIQAWSALNQADHLTSVGANANAIQQAQDLLEDAKAEYAALSGGDFVPGFEHPYEIGDTGPAGGKVFYLDDSKLHGLEAAPADVDINGAETGGNRFAWGCYGTAITGADDTLIGTGAQNTTAILAGCAQDNIAAQMAAQYVWPNGKTDGFLPSKAELAALYTNRHVVGGFDGNYDHWSSSEYSAGDAWGQAFDFGYQDFLSKAHLGLVRAVRAF
jgi:hypothetical protein